MMDLHETKEQSIHFRKKMLQDQINTNYQNEFDRLRGALAHSVLNEQSMKTLKNKVETLEKLGAKIA